MSASVTDAHPLEHELPDLRVGVGEPGSELTAVGAAEHSNCICSQLVRYCSVLIRETSVVVAADFGVACRIAFDLTRALAVPSCAHYGRMHVGEDAGESAAGHGAGYPVGYTGSAGKRCGGGKEGRMTYSSSCIL